MSGTNITMGELVDFVGGTFTEEVVGSHFIAGLLMLLFVGLWMYKGRAGVYGFVVILFPLLLVLSIMGFLPEWIMVIAIMGAGAIFIKGFMNLVLGA